MKAENLYIGQLGEEIAKEYLQKKGYKIIEHNYRTKYAEIDLITRKDSEFVFIEVRTKTNENFGTPEESLNRNKINRLIRNANAFASKENFQKYRIDAICIVLDENNKPKRLNHYENITF